MPKTKFRKLQYKFKEMVGSSSELPRVYCSLILQMLMLSWWLLHHLKAVFTVLGMSRTGWGHRYTSSSSNHTSPNNVVCGVPVLQVLCRWIHIRISHWAPEEFFYFLFVLKKTFTKEPSADPSIFRSVDDCLCFDGDIYNGFAGI